MCKLYILYILYKLCMFLYLVHFSYFLYRTLRMYVGQYSILYDSYIPIASSMGVLVVHIYMVHSTSYLTLHGISYMIVHVTWCMGIFCQWYGVIRIYYLSIYLSTYLPICYIFHYRCCDITTSNATISYYYYYYCYCCRCRC